MVFGILAALAYLFALRVPSELLRQGSMNIIRQLGSSICYGPPRCKSSTGLRVLRRQCTCNSKYAPLYAHYWYSTLKQIARHSNPFSAWSPSAFNATLREIPCKIGFSPNCAQKFSSHDFGRGCLKDILAEAGPAAMMSHCSWSFQRSAFHYVTRDEIDESIVSSLLADHSEEDTEVRRKVRAFYQD